MAVPRNRMSNARKNSKRAHHAKKRKNLAICDNCQTPHLPHFSCQACQGRAHSSSQQESQ